MSGSRNDSLSDTVQKFALVHSDLRWITPGLSKGVPPSRQAALESALDKLQELSTGRTLVVPTYDYSFTSSGLFDIRAKKTDLGALSSEVLRREDWLREETPVFSHAAFGCSIPATRTPFSGDSFFHFLSNTDSRIYLLGVDVSSMTFIHFVEDSFGIPYRYKKTFTGSISTITGSREASVSFHVRPKSGIVNYDFGKMSQLLTEGKVLHTFGPKSAYLKPVEALQIISSALASDPLWALTHESKKLVDSKLNFLGRQFEIGDFE